MPNKPASVEKLEAVESDLLVKIQDVALNVPGITSGARTLSHVGEHAAGWLALSAAGFAFDRKRRRQWAAVGSAAFCSHAASVVIKRIVRRQRPTDPRIKVGVSTPSTLSFPSSHATSTTATMVGLSHVTGSSAPLLGIPVMMISRMVLGVHYPTDTLVGAAIGALTTRAAFDIERKTR
ncbi:phosphatase PAP2 family protein [Corynebacterium tapiri]|uniref:Phosphatase PAP2 family protein n=1 Tax=Corynebacterium tapiri TaxID=1448266 RepID=A0A5C4U383_9CORY|nr:phosphatase PAP2 family protein [Corynebacterium tapiri]TNL95586.1 phosphatase PAP2 family protein [Corynebacterium tapiri]